MIRRAEIGQAEGRLGLEAISKCRGEARLADARLTGHQHDLAVACFGTQRRNRRSISSSRTIIGVSWDPRNASNRLPMALGHKTCEAGTGAAMPLSSISPRSRHSK